MTKENKKQSIDRKREGALSMEITDSEDTSAIRKMISISGNLYCLKDKSMSSISLADDIDPKRTNINVPNTYTKILEYGFQDQVIQRILLLAETLFNKTHLGLDVDCERALTESFEATKLLLEMQEIYDNLSNEVNVIKNDGLKPGTKHSQNIPVTKNLETRVKIFIHKVDLVRNTMIQLLKLFYDVKEGKKLLQNIKEAIDSKHGATTEMGEFFEQIRPGLEFSRNLRNAVEHPSKQKKLIILDYNLKPDTSVETPTIELIHPETDHPKTDAVFFLNDMINNLIDLFEVLVVNLCAKNLGHFGEFECGITQLSPETQKHRGTKYSYAICLNGEWKPLG